MYVCVWIVTLFHIKTMSNLTGLSVFQEGSRWPFITDVRSKFQTNPCVIFGKQNNGESVIRGLRFHSLQYQNFNCA